MKSTKEYEEYRYSSDNWHPNFKDNQVKVAMSLYVNGKNHVVNVWGDDDDGMEFWSKDPGITKNKFKKILKMKDITKKALTKLGLYQA